MILTHVRSYHVRARVGIGLGFFGFAVYYVIPLALLASNLTLLLNIFFMLLIMMILGLVLLSMNMQHSLEKLLGMLDRSTSATAASLMSVTSPSNTINAISCVYSDPVVILGQASNQYGGDQEPRCTSSAQSQDEHHVCAVDWLHHLYCRIVRRADQIDRLREPTA